eukprot:m.1405319 g.1405319  ORF g.1405319 m.1405319 type:complete len:83 (-) comp25012_c0_seq83:628-876(-)
MPLEVIGFSHGKALFGASHRGATRTEHKWAVEDTTQKSTGRRSPAGIFVRETLLQPGVDNLEDVVLSPPCAEAVDEGQARQH